MKKRPQPVVIDILGKEYRIVCEDSEKENLQESARELDRQMREIRDTAGINSTDRIAVMVALNLASELRQASQTSFPTGQGNRFAEKLAQLRHKIENVLENA